MVFWELFLMEISIIIQAYYMNCKHLFKRYLNNWWKLNFLLGIKYACTAYWSMWIGLGWKFVNPILLGWVEKNPPIQPMHTLKFIRNSVYVIQISQLMHLKKLYN